MSGPTATQPMQPSDSGALARKRHFRLTRFFGEKVDEEEIQKLKEGENRPEHLLPPAEASNGNKDIRRRLKTSDFMRKSKSVANMRSSNLYSGTPLPM